MKSIEYGEWVLVLFFGESCGGRSWCFSRENGVNLFFRIVVRKERNREREIV